MSPMPAVAPLPAAAHLEDGRKGRDDVDGAPGRGRWVTEQQEAQEDLEGGGGG